LPDQTARGLAIAMAEGALLRRLAAQRFFSRAVSGAFVPAAAPWTQSAFRVPQRFCEESPHLAGERTQTHRLALACYAILTPCATIDRLALCLAHNPG